MTSTPRHLTWSLAAAVAASLLPAMAHAATDVYQCGMTHFVRNAGTEMVSTTLSVRNADSVYAATVLQLTIRDGEGNVVHESGPATATPLPLNTDFPTTFPGGKNITVVPPGGMVYLRSNHIFGNNGLPGGAAGNELGQSLSASVTVAKEGRKGALFVSMTPRIRTRSPGPTAGSFVETTTLATGNTTCEPTP
jgi:hypothetical protein